MSTRERWIVYPLLFLALGIAMRNQFLPTKRMGAVDFMAGELSAQTIHCNNLEVMQDQKCRNLQFGVAQGDRIHTGYIESQRSRSTEIECKKQFAVLDEHDRPVVLVGEDQNTKAGAIQTMLPSGAPQVQIFSNATGGVVNAIGHLGQALVVMGHVGESFGVFAQFPQSGRPPFPITSPSRFQVQPSLPKVAPNPTPLPPADEKKEEPTKEESKPKDAGNP
jgi:hypothetical protein